jgi:hypothetical protein
MGTDVEIYAKCIAQVQTRLGVIDAVLSGRLPIPQPDVLTEVVFIQFRKSLEEFAFASLTANKDAYAAVHAKYSVHWRANDMLTELEKVNPSFYPIALEAPKKTQPGFAHFDRLGTGFMTRDEFATLHKRSSEVLHVRNPPQRGRFDN